MLFTDTRFVSSVLHPQYDVAPDDRRFLMIRRQLGDAAGTLVLVRNPFDELRPLVPR